MTTYILFKELFFLYQILFKYISSKNWASEQKRRGFQTLEN